MSRFDGSSYDRAGDHLRHAPQLAPDVWPALFQSLQVPIFIEDLTDVWPLIGQAVREADGGDLRGWLDGHPDFVGHFIASIRILDVNAAAVELNAAASREELLVSLEKLVLPETLSAFKDLICALADGRDYYEGEARYRALDGREYSTLNRARLPRGDDPLQLFTIVTTDVTKLKVAEQALVLSEERYRLLIETAQDAIVRHDLSGRITFINQAGAKMLGRTPAELIGSDGAQLLTPPSYAEALKRRAARQAGEPNVRLYETEVLHADGHVVPVEVNSTLLPGPLNGAWEPQILLVARDISQRRIAQHEQELAEARLRDTQRLEGLGVLAGGIAHEFNNLLLTIMGNAELLAAGEREEPDQESLAAILTAGGQAAALCRQMQAYAGASPQAPKPLDLTAVVAAMRPLLQASVSGGSQLHYELAADLPRVVLDGAQVRQTIMNMVANAAEAVGRGGEIKIRTGTRSPDTAGSGQWFGGELPAAAEHVFCEVRDSGCGMDAGTRARMFEPFFSTKFAGRGLGMSAALGIVQGHGGRFHVSSEVNQGTAVSFWLPVPDRLAHDGGGESEPVPRRSYDLHGRTILVVDDDAKVRAVAAGFLRRLGCKVLTAADGYDAVRLFGQRQAEIDAVVLDYTMPGLNGADTSRRLRVIRSDVPILLTSGHDEAGIRSASGEAAMARFIAKPYSLRQLNEALASILDV